MAPGGSRAELPLATLLEQAREAFPPRGKACYHLCLSHSTRRRVNKLVQRQRARRGEPALRLEGKPPQGQAMLIQRGVRQICVLETCKQGLWNSQLLTVTGFDNKTVSLKCDDTGAEYTVSHTFMSEKTSLGYCFTIASAQGRSLSDVAIW